MDGVVTFWAVVAVLCILLGALWGTRIAWHGILRAEHASSEGWVYFLSGPKEMETPIKVGFTHRDPCKDRLPEIRTMSPYPLRIIFKFWAPDVRAAETAVHQRLASSRLHGEWFDRDAALALIDHLKGAY